MVFGFCAYLVIGILSFDITPSYAEKITILYTGQTHAMLYPCNCPGASDGGIARRATKIKELSKNNPDTVIVDSGNFFAGGVMDEYSQNTELDKARTLINLKSLKMMGYDAACVSDDEFNFGVQFFQEQAATAGVHFLSCNVESNAVKSFIVKEVGGVKIGIAGVTTPVAKSKAGDLNFTPVTVALKEAVASLKQQGVDIIIVLSSLNSGDNVQLITDIPSIDIIIGNFSALGEELYYQKGTSFIIKPSWQGKHLGKAVVTVENKKVKKVEVDEIRMSSDIKDDKEIAAILPRCFSDVECRKENLVGLCQNPGKPNASCMYIEASRVRFFIVEPQDCKTCHSDDMEKFLKKRIPGLSPTYVKYPTEQGKQMVEDLGLDMLPAYLLGKEIEKEREFDAIRTNVEQKGDFYLIKPEIAGVSFYVKRKKIDNRFDVFISLYGQDTNKLLDTVKEFNPELHFLAVPSAGGFQASNGLAEVEEYLRAACVKKYYPTFFWDYISCRAKNIYSSWWEDCCASGIDAALIKKCAQSKEGTSLLKENVSLNKELGVMFGPTYLVDNNEIFSSKGVPTKEELTSIIKKR